MFWFEVARLIPLIVVVGYAAWKDHKTGEVTNKLWIYAPVGLTLTATQTAIFEPHLAVPILVSYAASTIIAFSLFYLGGWGGADAKALLTIGASMPLTPFMQVNLAFMYPVNIIWISAVMAFIVSQVKHQQTTRFLPYMMLGMFVALLV